MSPDCRHSVAAPQGGETGPSSVQLTETPRACLFGLSRTRLLLARDVGLLHSFFCKTGWGLVTFSSGGTATLAFGHDCSGAGMGSRDTTLS